LDGVEIKTFATSMALATLIFAGLDHYQKGNGVKSPLAKGAVWGIIGVYVLMSLYYLGEVVGSTKKITGG
jgi:hypothetical protein